MLSFSVWERAIKLVLLLRNISDIFQFSFLRFLVFAWTLITSLNYITQYWLLFMHWFSKGRRLVDSVPFKAFLQGLMLFLAGLWLCWFFMCFGIFRLQIISILRLFLCVFLILLNDALHALHTTLPSLLLANCIQLASNLNPKCDLYITTLTPCLNIPEFPWEALF